MICTGGRRIYNTKSGDKDNNPLKAASETNIWDFYAVDNAGYSPPFNWWSVFKALNPTSPDPAVIFGSSVGYIVVNTVTGEVTVE